MSSCQKGGLWQLALHLFNDMVDATVAPDVISYSAAISSCEKGQQWQMALHLFHKMEQDQLQPNVISYSATISACEKGGQWELALSLFESELLSVRLSWEETLRFQSTQTQCIDGFRNCKYSFG